MCGIAGSTRDPSGVDAKAMNTAMVHRGPDDEGVYADTESGVSLGARRLAIIDIEGGHQPGASEDSTVWAVLNGEIYNNIGLRSQLIRRATLSLAGLIQRCSSTSTRSGDRISSTQSRACTLSRSGTRVSAGYW